MTTTDRAETILEFIKRYRAERGYSPSVRNIMTACGFSSTSNVGYWLDDLEQRGLIKREPNTARSIRVIG
jgi:repressor LexA